MWGLGEKIWGLTRQKCQKKVPGARVRKEARPHKPVPQEQGQAARWKLNKEASLRLGGREGGRRTLGSTPSVFCASIPSIPGGRKGGP